MANTNGSAPADYTLPDGQPVRFDLYQMSRREWTNFVTGKGSPESDDRLLAQVTGMSMDIVQGLPHPAWRGLVKALVKKATEPLADPNSPSASSSA